MDQYNTPKSNLVDNSFIGDDPSPLLLSIEIWLIVALSGLILAGTEYLLEIVIPGVSLFQTFVPPFIVGYYNTYKLGRMLNKNTRILTLVYFLISIAILFAVFIFIFPVAELQGIFNSSSMAIIASVSIIISFALMYFALYLGCKQYIKKLEGISKGPITTDNLEAQIRPRV